MKIVDLRSDTITKPSPDMRAAMAAAEVGDDVFSEDPTVNSLQERIKTLTGKEAALFVSSGTQANQTAINAHTQPGDEVICEYNSHIFNYEAGAPAMLSGVQLHPLQGQAGVLDPDQVVQSIRSADHHFPRTRLICLENTHNRWGGAIYPLEHIVEIRKIADRFGLKMHLDGARLWNASVATGISIAEYSRYFDSVSLCFSKGLGAPVGSVVAGSGEFIDRVHYYRKAYGGGMRQSGILAAAALYAIDHNVDRLKEDHLRTKILAENISSLPDFSINPALVQTNIAIFEVMSRTKSAPEYADELSREGIKMIAFSSKKLRAVTHLDIDDSDIDFVIQKLNKLYRS